MAIDYDDVRSANSPDGLIDLLGKLGHEPELDWDGCADVTSVLLDAGQPKSVRNALNDAADTVRNVTSLTGETRGIECYVAILNPGQKLIAANTRSLSHAFRHVSHTTTIDEILLFIGIPPEDHVGDNAGDTRIVEWATIRLERVYRGASKSEELRLSRLDWKPTKVTRHSLDCLSSLAVDALPGQVVDEEVERFREEARKWLNKELLSQRFFKQFYKRFENGLDHFQLHAKAEGYDQFAPGLKKEVTKYTKVDRKNDSNREEAAKYLLKQVLRILFLHFLQEKEWMCRDRNFLLNQWRRYEHSTRSIANYDATRSTGFHEQVLVPLFFETLNRRRPDDSPNNWGPTRWDKGDRSLMPYLNGGIFEVDPAEKGHVDFEQTDNGQTVRPNILIPDSVFSGDRDYDPGVDNEILNGREASLLAFLDDFHFTIAEDTPVDEAVALDPELMGKIFENLLVSRHSDGAFYTPRSIVRFQCKDTLARYLEEQFAELGTQYDHDWFLDLLDLSRDFKKDEEPWNEELFTPVVADRIKQALMECKVLDPAVGSGAYLLGMLTEMLRLRQLCHMVRAKEFVDRGSTKFYEWKRDIIRNSLYGVDINPQAVSICHLRLWLAMIVDQDRDAASPLPNLDFQVTTGDSLRDSIGGHRIFVPPGQRVQATLWAYSGGKDDDGPSEAPILARIKRIRELRHTYYDENVAPSERDAMRVELQTLRQEMMIEGLNQLEHYELNQIKSKKMSVTKRDKVENDVIAKFNDMRRRIEDGTFTSIFSYEAIFGDVFQREGRKGFDIVIGNPPYLEDEGKGGYDDIQKLLGLKSNNLYAMFWIRGVRDLTRPGGQVSFITSDTFLTIRSHQETRKALLRESQIHYVIQTGNWFFTFNNAWTAILTVTTRQEALTEKQAWDADDLLVAYDITKLPPRDLAALDRALAQWKPTATSRARTVNIEADLTDEGDDTSWYLELDARGFSPIGRYAYPSGIIWRNSNLPIFFACPKIFKLTWDVGDWVPRPRNVLSPTSNEVEGSMDDVPIVSVQFNGKVIELVKLHEIADVKVGLQTGDDTFYLRKTPTARGSMGVIDSSLVLTHSDLSIIEQNNQLRKRIVRHGIKSTDFQGRQFVPFAKPPKQVDGELNMFWSPVEYYIDWSEDVVKALYEYSVADVKRRKDSSFVGTQKQEAIRAAVIRNPEYYFISTLHSSSAGEEAPQTWAPWGGVSGHKSCIIVPTIHEWPVLLGLMSSHPFVLLVKPFRGSLADTGQDQLAMTNVPVEISKQEVLKEIVTGIIGKKAEGDKVGRQLEEWRTIDTIISESYGLIDTDISEVSRWSKRRFRRPGVID